MPLTILPSLYFFIQLREKKKKAMKKHMRECENYSAKVCVFSSKITACNQQGNTRV